MLDISTANTWGQAVRLWFWTNVAGTLGFAVMFAVVDAQWYLPYATMSGMILTAGVIGLTVALASSPAILLAYVIFGQLLAIPERWLRLAATVAVILLGFAGSILLVASYFSNARILLAQVLISMVPCSLPYLLAALIAAGVAYRPSLFHPDFSARPDGTIDAAI